MIKNKFSLKSKSFRFKHQIRRVRYFSDSLKIFKIFLLIKNTLLEFTLETFLNSRKDFTFNV